MGGRTCSLRASLLATALSTVSLLVLTTMLLSVLMASGALRGVSVCSTCGPSAGEQRRLAASPSERVGYEGVRLPHPACIGRGRGESGGEIENIVVVVLSSTSDVSRCCSRVLAQCGARRTQRNSSQRKGSFPSPVPTSPLMLTGPMCTRAGRVLGCLV